MGRRNLFAITFRIYDPIFLRRVESLKSEFEEEINEEITWNRFVKGGIEEYLFLKDFNRQMLEIFPNLAVKMIGADGFKLNNHEKFVLKTYLKELTRGEN